MTEQEERAAVQAFAEAAVALEDAKAAVERAGEALEQAQDAALETTHIRYPVVAHVADGRQVAIDPVLPGDGRPYFEYTIGHSL